MKTTNKQISSKSKLTETIKKLIKMEVKRQLRESEISNKDINLNVPFEDFLNQVGAKPQALKFKNSTYDDIENELQEIAEDNNLIYDFTDLEQYHNFLKNHGFHSDPIADQFEEIYGLNVLLLMDWVKVNNK